MRLIYGRTTSPRPISQRAVLLLAVQRRCTSSTSGQTEMAHYGVVARAVAAARAAGVTSLNLLVDPEPEELLH